MTEGNEWKADRTQRGGERVTHRYTERGATKHWKMNRKIEEGENQEHKKQKIHSRTDKEGGETKEETQKRNGIQRNEIQRDKENSVQRDAEKRLNSHLRAKKEC